MARREKAIKEQIARYWKEQIIPEITDKEVEVRFQPSMTAEEAVVLFKAGAISREYLREILDITDDGKTFVPIESDSDTTSLNSIPDSMKTSTDNKDDNPTRHRQGTQNVTGSN